MEVLKIFKYIRKLLLYLSIILFVLITSLFVKLIGELENINYNFQYKSEILISVIIIIALIIILTTIINYLFIKEKVVNSLKLESNFISKLESCNNDEEKIINKEIDFESEKIEVFSNEDNYKILINDMANPFYNFIAIEDENGFIVDGILLDLNEAGAEFLNSDKKNLLGFKFSEIYKSFDLYKVYIMEMINKVKISKPDRFSHDINLIDDKWGNVSIYSLEEGYFSIIINDITRTKNYSDQMKYLANHDELTGLLNRASIFECIKNLIRKGIPFSIYSIDLDNFKSINETLGYKSGDQVLEIIGRKLNLLKDKKINSARICSDEFMIIKEEENSEKDSEIFITSIFDILSEGYNIDIYKFKINSSIGVSYFPKHSKDPTTVLKYSSISMESAKRSFGNKFEIFSDKMLDSLNLERELREAINKEEFEVYYQPIYDLRANKIVEAEALIRWIKDDSIISPNEFLPIAKKNGEIIKIDQFVIREASKYCKSLISLGEKDFKVSINISHALLKQSYVVDLITEIVKEEGLEPRYIKLEITEDETIDDIDYARDILAKLKNVGFSISLDDFGVGYSSFNHLKRLPLDTLKIDRSLLLSIENDKKTILIMKMLIKLAHTLDLDIICEGVEEKEQMNLLRKLDCNKVQGYYISRPLRQEDFNRFIVENNNIIIS